MATALEVDFTHCFMGVDFREVMWGGPGIRWPPRRLMAHVEALSHYTDSAYRRLMMGAGADREAPSMMLAVINQLTAMRYELATLLGAKPDQPEMAELPELRNKGKLAEWEDGPDAAAPDEDEGPHFASAKEIMQFLGGIKRGTVINK